MLDKPISPLHQRMIDDMTARRFSEATRRDYARHVRNFEAFLGRSPETATCEDLRDYQLHVAEQKIGAATVNSAVSALRFFFNVTLERPDLVRHLTSVQEPRKAPVVLNQEEVVRFLEAAPGLKYKAVFGVAYGAGLRVSEVAALKVSDIPGSSGDQQTHDTCGSNRARGGKIATSCSRRNCSNGYANGGKRRTREVGCSRARTPSTRCRLASSCARFTRQRKRRGLPSA